MRSSGCVRSALREESRLRRACEGVARTRTWLRERTRARRRDIYMCVLLAVQNMKKQVFGYLLSTVSGTCSALFRALAENCFGYILAKYCLPLHGFQYSTLHIFPSHDASAELYLYCHFPLWTEHARGI